MGRPRRIIISGEIYHVTSRGNNKKTIFKDDQDYKIYLKFLRECLREYQLKIILYVLMPNHVHILIKIISEDGKQLSKFIHKLHTRYTKYFNKRYETIGHLFQRRYFSKHVGDDTYLLELSRYIHQNPIVTGSVEKLDDYPYSSYPVYLMSDKDSILKRHLIVETDEILKYFGKKPYTQRRRYKKFVEENIDSISVPGTQTPVPGTALLVPGTGQSSEVR